MTPHDRNLMTLAPGDRAWLDGLSRWMDSEVERRTTARGACPGCTSPCGQCLAGEDSPLD